MQPMFLFINASFENLYYSVVEQFFNRTMFIKDVIIYIYIYNTPIIFNLMHKYSFY